MQVEQRGNRDVCKHHVEWLVRLAMQGAQADADHVANTAVAGKPLPGATYATIKELVATRCQADAWTDETKQCFHAIAKILDGRVCANQLTEEQRKALHTQALALSKGATPGSDPDDHNSDWIRHVVEEPGTRTR